MHVILENVENEGGKKKTIRTSHNPIDPGETAGNIFVCIPDFSFYVT